MLIDRQLQITKDVIEAYNKKFNKTYDYKDFQVVCAVPDRGTDFAFDIRSTSEFDDFFIRVKCCLGEKEGIDDINAKFDDRLNSEIVTVKVSFISDTFFEIGERKENICHTKGSVDESGVLLVEDELIITPDGQAIILA